MTRRLFVTADDAGADPARDAAILEAADRGIVRQASLVANGPTVAAFVEAARRRPGLGLGLHLNLTSGAPLAGERAFTLTGADGAFLGSKERFWTRAVDGQVDPREVERETLAQWRRLEGLGVVPVHVNGHQHVHVLPAVADGMRAALRFLRARVVVRVPVEGMPPQGHEPVGEPAMPLGTTVLSASRLAQLRAGHLGIASLGAHADALRTLLGPEWPTTEAFTGLAYAMAPSVARFRASVAAARGATVEFMVHPGRWASGGAHSADSRRDREREVLLDPALAAGLAEDGVELASFRDLLS